MNKDIINGFWHRLCISISSGEKFQVEERTMTQNQQRSEKSDSTAVLNASILSQIFRHFLDTNSNKKTCRDVYIYRDYNLISHV